MQLIRDDNPQAQTRLSKLHQVVHLPLVDEATAVGVGVPDPAAALPAAEPPADAADGPLQLLAADAPVPVGVELHQPLLELLHRHVPVHRPGGGGGGGARGPDGHGNTYWKLLEQRPSKVLSCSNVCLLFGSFIGEAERHDCCVQEENHVKQGSDKGGHFHYCHFHSSSSFYPIIKVGQEADS